MESDLGRSPFCRAEKGLRFETVEQRVRQLQENLCKYYAEIELVRPGAIPSLQLSGGQARLAVALHADETTRFLPPPGCEEH